MDKLIINLFFIAFITIGAYSIASINAFYGVLFVFFVLLCATVMAFAFCTKCASCQKKCAHPHFGIMRRILPKRKINAYTWYDYLGLLPFGLVAVVMPQYWLWQTRHLFAAYWISVFIVVIGIVTRLCTQCENRYCKMNRNSEIHGN